MKESNGIDGGTGCKYIFFRIDIVSTRRVSLKNSCTIGENFEVNISSEETETLFPIVMDIHNQFVSNNENAI